MTDQPRANLLRHVTNIVTAHLRHNRVAPDDLGELIQSVHRALSGLGNTPPIASTEPETRKPAVPVRKSVQPDHIVCLEDGAKLVMLKRYLRTRFGLTPEAYRERWGLPASYPMVAPSYASKRSDMAKRAGLGRSGGLGSGPNAPVEPSRGEQGVAVTKLRARRARGAGG